MMYRKRILEIIEEKLLQMNELAELAKQSNLSPKELKSLNTKLNSQVAQVNSLDEESRRTEYKESDE